MQKSRGKETPVLAAKGERANIGSPEGHVESGHLLEKEDHDVNCQQCCSDRIATKSSHTHAAACTSGGNSGTTVTQDGSYTFFVDRKGSAAFEAAWHGYKDNKENPKLRRMR